jgi:hypothetical protein
MGNSLLMFLSRKYPFAGLISARGRKLSFNDHVLNLAENALYATKFGHFLLVGNEHAENKQYNCGRQIKRFYSSDNRIALLYCRRF